MQPPSRDPVTKPEPRPEENRKHRARCHDAVEQFALHYLEALDAYGITAASVIDKQAGQIKKPGKPGHYKNDM